MREEGIWKSEGVSTCDSTFPSLRLSVSAIKKGRVEAIGKSETGKSKISLHCLHKLGEESRGFDARGDFDGAVDIEDVGACAGGVGDVGA